MNCKRNFTGLHCPTQLTVLKDGLKPNGNGFLPVLALTAKVSANLTFRIAQYYGDGQSLLNHHLIAIHGKDKYDYGEIAPL